MSVRFSPPPRAPPKGLTGIWEGYQFEPGSILETSDFPVGMVLLNVYDVSDGAFERINKIATANNNILVGGVFHAGVEVYAKEWCYGVTEYGRSGVAAVYPRSHPQHTYRCTVPIAETPLSEEEVLQLCRRLSEEWPGHEYDLIHHNCLSFCNALLKELVPGKRIPGWVDRAARAGASIDILSRRVKEDTQHTVQLVRTMTSELEQKARQLASEEALSELPVQAAETMESLQRESVKAIDAARVESAKALEIARKESEKLAEKASQHIEVLGSSLRTSGVGTTLLEWGEGLRTSAQQSLEDQDFELPPEIAEQAEVLRRKSQELSEEVGEKAQALGASLWQWGQNLQTSSVWGLAGEATSNLQASVSSFVEKGSDSQPPVHAPQIATKGLLDEDEDSLLGRVDPLDDDLLLDTDASLEERRSLGMIRSEEEKSMQQGLLVEEEEDDLLDLKDVATSIKESQKKLPVVEAPMEWLSSSPSTVKDALPMKQADCASSPCFRGECSSKAENAVPAKQPDVWDLLA